MKSLTRLSMPMGRARAAIMALCCLLVHLEGWADAGGLPPLNPYGQQKRLTGKFIWYDLATHDVGAAKRFYGNVFSWDCTTLGQDRDAYTLIRHQGRPIGGIVLDERAGPGKNDSQWIGFLSVPNVKRAERLATKHGGRTIVAPTHLAGRGEYGVFTDSEGALFGVCTSSSGDPPDYQPRIGEWLWAERWSAAPAKAAEFYQGIGDYVARQNPAGSDCAAFHLESQGYARAGVIRIPDERIKPGWLYYVRVEDVGETVAKVKANGGKVLVGDAVTANAAPVAIIEDPTGAVLGVAEWEPASRQTKEGETKEGLTR